MDWDGLLSLSYYSVHVTSSPAHVEGNRVESDFGQGSYSLPVLWELLADVRACLGLFPYLWRRMVRQLFLVLIAQAAWEMRTPGQRAGGTWVD